MTVCSYNISLSCNTVNCNGYSVAGCMPLNFINQACFPSQYCNRFPNCTLLNELYSEELTDYTCQDTIYTPPSPVPNNSTILRPIFIYFMIINLIISILHQYMF
jgi:hypothetical protein